MKKKTAVRARKAQDQAEIVVGGAGEWIIKDGKFYDPIRKRWVKRCRNCKQTFYAVRRDAKTCGVACRVAIQRKSLKSASTDVWGGDLM